MEHDSVATQVANLSPEMSMLLEEAMSATAHTHPERGLAKRGRPARLSPTHLAWAVVWGLLMGYRSQLELWRLIGLGFRHFAPLRLSNQAIYKRLSQSGLCALHDVLMQVSSWLGDSLAGLQEERLAPFARDVLVLDESKLDQVGRWLSGLRDLPAGDPRLLAGRLACLFDLRRQQWRRVDLLPEAVVDCKVHARALLEGVRTGTLLLMDLGYFSFEWFDELTALGHFWVSRLRQKTSYEIIHVLVCRDGYSEALVWLGAYRADRAAHAVRLIMLRSQGQWTSYLTNVLDPRVLSGAEVVQLYARRWDIELAFRTLKDHLGGRLLWSARFEVIGCQILACVLLANLLQATQRQIAAQAGVEVFDVSLDLLLRYIPRLLHRGLDPVVTLVSGGRDLGIIRPSTRGHMRAPEIAWHEIFWPPADLVIERAPRYAHNPGGHARRKQNKAT